MAQVFVKRAKIFMSNDGGKRVTVSPGHPVKVPDWVRETPSWKPGIEDGSILDITPTKAPIAEPDADELTEAQPVSGDNKNPGEADEQVPAKPTSAAKAAKAAAKAASTGLQQS